MNIKIATIAGLAIAASGATADVLLEIDLTVANQVTISATSGLASVSASGSAFTGVLLADFFAVPGAPGSVGSGTGNLSTFSNPSDGSPALFQGFADTGLNIWSFTTDSSISVAGGQQAFSGSSTWTLDATQYAAFLGGAAAGDVWMNADTDDDISSGSATNIGTYRVVPAPSSLALLGLGGLAATRRRR